MKHNKSSRRQILEALAERVTGTRHVNRWMILLMDLFISTFATIMIFWIMGYILDAYTFIKVGFRAAGISLVCAFVAFMIFGTHKEILRYTTSREIGVLVLAVFVKTALELTCLVLVKKNLGLGREIINAKLGLIEVVNFSVTVSGLVFFRLFLVHLYAYSLAVLGGGGRKKVLVFGDDDEEYEGKKKTWYQKLLDKMPLIKNRILNPRHHRRRR